jgi:DNA-binding beta-propeller fold protein YncE
MRDIFRLLSRITPALLAALPLGALAAANPAPPQYRLAQQMPLPGDEGWDYLAFEPGGHRLFVSHGTRVLVVDTEKLAVVGEIADTPGVHGIALAPDLNRGFISAGRSGVVVVFDLKSLARLQEIKVTGDNPDAILYDPASQRVFTFNGRGRNATAIDAKSGEVVGTIALDAKPEFAASDGKGHVYVNLEDRSSIAVIDPRRLAVTAVWPVAGCEEPSGLALDAQGGHLFPVCSNKVMAMVDTASGHVLGTAPIGGSVDAAAFDPGTHLAFASCGEGVLTVVRPKGAAAPEVVQSLSTARGARTLALDAASHRVYLVTADFGPEPPATAEQPRPRPKMLPGTFRLLVLEPGAPAAKSAASGHT